MKPLNFWTILSLLLLALSTGCTEEEDDEKNDTLEDGDTMNEDGDELEFEDTEKDDWTDDDDDDNDDNNDDDDPFTWIVIPDGEYNMGCSEGDDYCEETEKPAHWVTISSFQLSAYEVTEEQYTAIMGENPSYPGDCASCPVNNITWEMANTFCQTIGARLPTEAEWEYAARAGSTTMFACGQDSDCLDEIAWWNRTATDGSTHSIGGKTPNAFGLYDMLGNAREWVADCWNDSYFEAPTNGEAWMTGNCDRVINRGGSWGDNPDHLRSSSRLSNYKVDADTKFGVRCAKDL